jgi:hypothetical protein
MTETHSHVTATSLSSFREVGIFFLSLEGTLATFGARSINRETRIAIATTPLHPDSRQALC